MDNNCLGRHPILLLLPGYEVSKLQPQHSNTLPDCLTHKRILSQCDPMTEANDGTPPRCPRPTDVRSSSSVQDVLPDPRTRSPISSKPVRSTGKAGLPKKYLGGTKFEPAPCKTQSTCLQLVSFLTVPLDALNREYAMSPYCPFRPWPSNTPTLARKIRFASCLLHPNYNTPC